jgi:hypothetical protein
MVHCARILGVALSASLAMPGIAAGQATVHPVGVQERMRVDGQIEKKYLIKLETTEHKRYCKAKASFEYTQRNTLASVIGVIENDDCAASGGDYRLSVRVRDQNGDIRTVDHDEQWQREDDRPFTFEKHYAIGENVDLLRVRASKIICICAEPPLVGDESAIEGEDHE